MYGSVYDFENVKGKVVDSIELSSDKERVMLRFQDGSAVAYGVEGDCCSRSWIEHLEAPRNLRGATILDVVESSVDVTEDDAYNPVTRPDDHYYKRDHESLMLYNTRFVTDRGEVVLEYRNSSNGYYGGYLVTAEVE